MKKKEIEGNRKKKKQKETKRNKKKEKEIKLIAGTRKKTNKN